MRPLYIWLTHMFFYLYLFKELIMKAQYPILMLAFMLLLCIITSYVIMGIEYIIYNFIGKLVENNREL